MPALKPIAISLGVILGIIFPSLVQAQHSVYTLFRPGVMYWYPTDLNWQIHQTNDQHFVPLTIDSSKFGSGDSVHYLSNYVQFPDFIQCHNYAYLWAGVAYRVDSVGNQSLELDSGIQALVLPEDKRPPWTLMNLNNNRSIEVIKVIRDTLSVLGYKDSVLQLQLRLIQTSSGNSLVDFDDSLSIIIGKNLGVMQTINLNELRIQDTLSNQLNLKRIKLIGNSVLNGRPWNPTHREVNDFDLGNVFIYKVLDLSRMDVQTSHDFKIETDSIIGKRDYGNRLVYDVYRETFSYDVDHWSIGGNMGVDTFRTYTQHIDSLVIDNPNDQILRCLPYKTSEMISNSFECDDLFQFDSDKMTWKWTREISRQITNLGPDCSQTDIEGQGYVHYYYGLGKESYWTHGSQANTTARELIYFKKNDQSWGDRPVSVQQYRVAQKDIHLFPNPSSGTIHLSGLPIHWTQLEVIDLGGRVKFSEANQAMDPDAEDFEIDLSNLEPGTYILKVASPSGVIRKKVVKTVTD
ncbi:T9SS type A sorting domain-containing protein [bacterium SCSIO 12741]|nr:T9SS type A sorting domain-containing protein [bacterium SCSIO 12741]